MHHVEWLWSAECLQACSYKAPGQLAFVPQRSALLPDEARGAEVESYRGEALILREARGVLRAK